MSTTDVAGQAGGATHTRPERSLPTGEQFTLHQGAQVATITEVGGGLRTYEVDGRPLLDGFEADQRVTGGRGQILLPWPNRIRGGRYTWRGHPHQLDLSEPETSGAIHGLTRWASWTVGERSTDHLQLLHLLHPCPGWPFILKCELTYRLGSHGLTVETRVTNVGDAPLPYGTGAHPYLRGGAGMIDEAALQVPAGLRLLTDDVGIPVGRQPVEGSHYDFRELRRIGDTQLDVTLTGLVRDPDGRARVRLEAGDDHRLTVWMDAAYGYVQLYTGDALSVPGERRRSLAIEPMTCAPDAFNSGGGLVSLDPGASHVATWGIEVL